MNWLVSIKTNWTHKWVIVRVPGVYTNLRYCWQADVKQKQAAGWKSTNHRSGISKLTNQRSVNSKLTNQEAGKWIKQPIGWQESSNLVTDFWYVGDQWAVVGFVLVNLTFLLTESWHLPTHTKWKGSGLGKP